MTGSDLQTEREDQATRLRQLMRARYAVVESAQMISITSGKGGVGKTNIAVNVAIALAARGQRVLLLDMDMGLANADVVLGVDAAVNWWHVLRGGRDIREAIVPAPGGIDLLAGGSGLAGLTDLSDFERHRLLRDLESLRTLYNVIVLDCGAGISRTVVAFGLAADLVAVVATPEPTALTDAYAMIKMLSRQNTRRAIGLVVNQAVNRAEAALVFDRIAGVAARFLRFPLTDLGYVLQDESVAVAVRRRRPVLLNRPGSAAGGCMRAVADRIAREQGLPEVSTSFFRRVANLFL
jgi:flagellar biosynthesis protein FlhG